MEKDFEKQLKRVQDARERGAQVALETLYNRAPCRASSEPKDIAVFQAYCAGLARVAIKHAGDCELHHVANVNFQADIAVSWPLRLKLLLGRKLHMEAFAKVDGIDITVQRGAPFRISAAERPRAGTARSARASVAGFILGLLCGGAELARMLLIPQYWRHS